MQYKLLEQIFSVYFKVLPNMNNARSYGYLELIKYLNLDIISNEDI